jgi:hypothetical protein
MTASSGMIESGSAALEPALPTEPTPICEGADRDSTVRGMGVRRYSRLSAQELTKPHRTPPKRIRDGIGFR